MAPPAAEVTVVLNRHTVDTAPLALASGAFRFLPTMNRDYITITELETMLAAGLRVYLRSGVEVRRVIPRPAPKSGWPLFAPREPANAIRATPCL